MWRIINDGKGDIKIEIIADYTTMQSIEYDKNGKVSKIIFRSADEIERLYRLKNNTKTAP